MNIGIDIFSFDKPGQNFGVGPGVYVWHLLPELFLQGKDHHFIVFANKDNQRLVPKYDNVTVVVNRISNRIRMLRVLHEQIYLVYQAVKYRLDIIHFLGNNISYLLAKISVLTVYDLMWKYYLERGNKSLKYFYFSITVPLSIKKSRAIITISDFIAKQVRDEFHRTKGVYPILLAPCALHPVSIISQSRFEQRYNFRYFYTVTTSMQHKNLITLLKAFARLKINKGYSEKLIISGQLKGDFHKSTIAFIEENCFTNDVIITGFIPEEEKTYLYKNADVFIYPSLYEGFGLPVLEAMSVGTPVIASHAASIPEVGGNSCLYFDPNSVDDLIEKIKILINDSNLKEKFRQKGKEQYKIFSWGKVARETLSVYHELDENKNIHIAYK